MLDRIIYDTMTSGATDALIILVPEGDLWLPVVYVWRNYVPAMTKYVFDPCSLEMALVIADNFGKFHDLKGFAT